jgi:hypothetical protein
LQAIRKCPCGLRQLHLSLCQRLLRQCGGLRLGLLGPWRVNPLFQTLKGYKERGFCGLVWLLPAEKGWRGEPGANSL